MSTLVAQTISNGTVSTSSANVIQGSAKAWVNFNGNTSPGTINASYNVSSVTKNSTGNWTINFTNAFTDTNYAFVGSGLPNDTAGTNGNFMVGGSRTSGPTLKSTTQCTVVNGSTSSNVFWDNLQAMCAFFR